MVQRGEGRLIARELLTPTLGIFRFELAGGVPAFEAGQYLTLGLVGDDDKLVWRPYSVASAPSETRFVEFLVRWAVHPVEGAFTTLLGRMEEGDRVRWTGPRGRFTLRDRLPNGEPDCRRLLLVGAGTGLAPFVSFVDELVARADEREIVLVQGASYVDELAYRERFERLAREGKLRYFPTISRPVEDRNRDWQGASGRVEHWLEQLRGVLRLEVALDVSLDPTRAMAYLCGPEGTVDNALRLLATRGYCDARHPQPDGRFDLLWEAYG